MIRELKQSARNQIVRKSEGSLVLRATGAENGRSFISFRPLLLGVRLALLVAGLLLLPGCWVKVDPKPTTTEQPMTRVKGGNTGGGNGQKVQQDPVIVPPTPGPTEKIFAEQMDPCAARLHDIEGALLGYYLVKGTFPTKLEDAAAFADFGQRPDNICPLCNKPYVYLPPGGTTVAGQVLAFAPVPAKDGKYRAIKMRPAAGTNLGSLPDVVTMTPEEMKPYLSHIPK